MLHHHTLLLYYSICLLVLIKIWGQHRPLITSLLLKMGFGHLGKVLDLCHVEFSTVEKTVVFIACVIHKCCHRAYLITFIGNSRLR
jgi:hypothetical protein